MRKSHLIKFTVLLSLLLLLVFPYLALGDYSDGYYDVGVIVDGDTFKLTDGKSVRLIGIDTPEIGERCATEAEQQLSSLISGQTVYLEKDVSETDQYNRLLRYVYADGIFVNDRLVYDGYAYAVEYPPDTKYSTQFQQSEYSAESSGRGCLWGDYCPSDMYVHITATGSKYHKAGCRYLSQSDILICKDEAISQGYTSCSVCYDSTSTETGSSSACFVSTVAYGSLIDHLIRILIKFRDDYLLTNKLGRSFVNIYYSYSPELADFISQHESLKTFSRLFLLPIIGLSWVILKLGLAATLLITIFFSGGLIYILRFKKNR